MWDSVGWFWNHGHSFIECMVFCLWPQEYLGFPAMDGPHFGPQRLRAGAFCEDGGALKFPLLTFNEFRDGFMIG